MATMVLSKDIQVFARTKRRSSSGKFGENADGVLSMLLNTKKTFRNVIMIHYQSTETEIS
jgi:hypothetical protein